MTDAIAFSRKVLGALAYAAGFSAGPAVIPVLLALVLTAADIGGLSGPCFCPTGDELTTCCPGTLLILSVGIIVALGLFVYGMPMGLICGAIYVAFFANARQRGGLNALFVAAMCAGVITPVTILAQEAWHWTCARDLGVFVWPGTLCFMPTCPLGAYFAHKLSNPCLGRSP
ncbi:MAG TPA: hypothetical protein VMJ31_08915 [Methylocystis sp.]|nr:hypothetical protein [Methylocystis sp.]